MTSDLTERLDAQGFDFTLFAPAGSETRARLVATTERPLSLIPAERRRDVEDMHIRAAVDVALEEGLDLVHSHLHVHVLRQASRLRCPLVTTLHGAAWDSAHHAVLRDHGERPYVSLSDNERAFLPELNYVATIPNRIAMRHFPAGAGSGGYLVFVGRLAPEKGAHLAVEVARRSGHPLLMAGVIEEQYHAYADGVLAATGPGIDYVGALERPELSMLLRDASALLMPLLWDEPFGLVVVESLASGTPVVAWRRGAMPEIIDDGETGILVDSVDEAVEALDLVSRLSREHCTDVAGKRFSDLTTASGMGVCTGPSPNPSPR